MSGLPQQTDAASRLGERLQDAFGPRYRASGSEISVAPDNERELLLAMKLVRDHGAQLGRTAPKVRLVRRALRAITRLDADSATVVAEAGATLEEIDREAAAHGLGVGAVSPGAMAQQLGDFLEGPYAGLRAVPAGRLEPLALALTAVMPDGLVASSRAAPRRATGPEWDAFFLGAGGRFGLTLRATIRLWPRTSISRSAAYEFASTGPLVDTIRRALLDGAVLHKLRVGRQGTAYILHAEVGGSVAQAERDLAALAHRANERGGTSAAGSALAYHSSPGHEREVRWEAVAEALAAGGACSLYRSSIDAAIAHGAIAGRDLTAEASWGHPALAAIAEALDPGRTLGGAP